MTASPSAEREISTDEGAVGGPYQLQELSEQCGDLSIGRNQTLMDFRAR